MDEKDRLFLLDMARYLGADFRCYDFDRVVMLDPLDLKKRALMVQAMFCFGMQASNSLYNTAGTHHKRMTEFIGPWLKRD